jgi:enoyl-CoA hydratase/carnithine racemase
MTDASPLLLKREGAVARLCIDRPAQRQAVSRALWRAFPGLLAQLDADPAVKVVAVQSTTPACFSSGPDMAELAELAGDADRAQAAAAEAQTALAALAGLGKPSVALVRGLCLGGGCAIALACDLRFANESARFGITEARLGLLPPFAALRALVARIGPARAADLAFSGRLLSGADAERIGLVEDVWPDEQFESAAGEYVAALCAVSQLSLRGSKAMLRAIAAGAATEPPRLRELAAQAYAGADFREACSALAQKRTPAFPWR